MLTKLLPGILILLALTACGSPIETNMSREIIDFQAVNQNGKTVHLPDDLAGSYWIADLIFTSCETVCPPMTANMARLQMELKEEGIQVPLRSFSIDPKTDTPEKLKEFADAYQPDYSQWSFLTGYTFKEVKELSIKSFQAPLAKLQESQQYAHGTSFYLVNPEGDVIKSYSGTNVSSIEKIVNDLKQLLHAR